MHRGFRVVLRRVFVVLSCLFMVFCAFVICHFGGSFSIGSAKGAVPRSGGRTRPVLRIPQKFSAAF
jgi:hypothetical protein